MTKNSTYKEKISILKSWFPEIIGTAKKELRNEHLRNDFNFCKTHFAGKNPSKLSLEELIAGYQKALDDESTAESLWEFIAQRWLLKQGDVYDFFVTELSKISPDFTAIEEISDDNGRAIIASGEKDFDIQNLYIFSVLNSVAFSEKMFQEMGHKANQAAKSAKAAEEVNAVERSIEKLISNHEAVLARTIDKYEKKLSGLEKKYHHDVDMLKKQVSNLQKKIAG